MMTDDNHERHDDGASRKPAASEQAGEDEGSSAKEGREDHLKEDQKTTSR